MKRYLVTGGLGFIGSCFVRDILDNETGVFIMNVDCLTYAGNKKNLEDKHWKSGYHRHFNTDIRDKEKVEKLFEIHKDQIDAIIHFAAESSVDNSIEGPAVFAETNVMGTLNLLEGMRKYCNKEGFKFIHVSTDEVYGSLTDDEPAFTEETKYDPSSPYSASKAAADHLVNSYHRTYGLPTIITNCSNNYGPYQYPEKLLPVMITKAHKGEKLPVYGEGKEIRDWLHVEDHVSAIKFLLENGKLGETYNIGGEHEERNIDVVKRICKTIDKEYKLMRDEEGRMTTGRAKLIKFIPNKEARPGHDYRYAVNCDKLKALGWKQKHNFEDGLKQTIDWYIENKDWNEESTMDDYQKQVFEAGSKTQHILLNPGESDDKLSYSKYERAARWALGQIALNPDANHWAIVASAIEESIESNKGRSDCE